MVNSENDSPGADERSLELEPLDSGHGPARPLSAREVAALSERLTRALGTGAVRSRSRSLTRLLVIGAATTTAAAAAAMYGSEWFPGRAPDAAPAELTRGRPVAAPAAAATEEPTPDRDGRPAEAASPAPPPASEPSEPNAVDLRSVARHSPVAEDHLARANSLRGEHRYREALDLYLHVAREYPRSQQARAAQLAAAALCLEQLRDVDTAERLYRAVQAGSGERPAEADFGLAEVARARGDRAGEKRALREFLERHAGHPLEAAAERRMNALGSP
jgi:tetratricopeptide (TPR) repeat protein